MMSCFIFRDGAIKIYPHQFGTESDHLELF